MSDYHETLRRSDYYLRLFPVNGDFMLAVNFISYSSFIRLYFRTAPR